MRHITEEQAKEMRSTVSERSASFVDFGAQVAWYIGDVIAYDIYSGELRRRIDVECGTYQIDPLDAIPTWEAVNPNT